MRQRWLEAEGIGKDGISVVPTEKNLLSLCADEKGKVEAQAAEIKKLQGLLRMCISSMGDCVGGSIYPHATAIENARASLKVD